MSKITGMFCYRYRDDIDMDAYQAEAFRMYELLTSKPEFGFLSMRTYTGDGGENVLVAEFSSHEGLAAWRDDPEHRKIQDRGRDEWFQSYWTAEVVVRATFDRDHGRNVLRTEPVGS